MIDLCPNVTDFAAPRPKRKYTVTERVLAANRANLALANAVPPEIRFRPTERRRQACYRNLQCALIAKKRDRSVNYATSFRHGWYAADPERALALVGATAEEYHRHLEAWRREVDPQDAEEEKLAHALGMLSWRWIAGVRLEGDLETLKVCRLLDALAAERGGTAGSTATPGCASDAQWEPRVTVARLTELGYDIQEALGGWPDLEAPLDKIRTRMLRLWQELQRMRGEPLMNLAAIGCRGRRHEVVVDHELHSAFALAEPFQSSGSTGEALRSAPQPLTAVGHWRNPPAPEDVSGARPQSAAVPRPPTFDAGFESEEALDSDDLLEGLPAADAALLREARRVGWELPGDFEGFLKRVRAALGPGLGTAAPGAHGRKCRDSVRSEKDWARRVRLFARALWKRLGALRRHADEVLNWLNRHLGDSTSHLWPEGTLRPELSARLTLHGTIGEILDQPLDEPEEQAERRGEGLAQFYFERLAALTNELIERWRRCRAVMAVVCRRE